MAADCKKVNGYYSVNDERKIMLVGVNENSNKTFVNEMEVMTAREVGSGIAKKEMTARSGSGIGNDKITAQFSSGIGNNKMTTQFGSGIVNDRATAQSGSGIRLTAQGGSGI